MDQSLAPVGAPLENDEGQGMVGGGRKIDGDERDEVEELERGKVGEKGDLDLELPVWRDSGVGRGNGGNGRGDRVEDEDEDEKLENGKRKRIEVPDSDAASLGDGEEAVVLSPGGGDGGVIIEMESVDGKLETRKERKSNADEENTPEEPLGAIQETPEKRINILETAPVTEEGTNGIIEMDTEATPNQNILRGEQRTIESNTTTTQPHSATQDKTGNTNALSSVIEADDSPVISEPRATGRDHQLSTAMTPAQLALQLYPGSSSQSSQEPKVPESIPEKEDVIMLDGNKPPTEAMEIAENADSQPQSTVTQHTSPSLPTHTAQPRVIPDSDEEDELSSPIKQPRPASKDTILPDTPRAMILSPKKTKSSTNNLLSSSPQKSTLTPLQPTNTPTKPTTTQLPSSPPLPPPPAKRKLPPSNLNTCDSILRSELKTIKLASLQSRNASLTAEIAAKKAQLEEVTKKLEGPADETVKRHIRLLHEYNDLRDVGQGLLGLVADNRGVGRVGELYEEFGVGLKD